MKDLHERALERITKVRVKLMLDMPFFGVLALGLKLVDKDSIGTAGTDGRHLFYNCDFIETLTDEELGWVIVHELLHPALGHLWRKDDRMHMVWNMACDYALHCIMVDYVALNQGGNILKMPKGLLYDRKFNGMSAEQIYDKIIDKAKDNKSGFDGGDGLGNHDKWDDIGSGEKDDLENDWRSKVVDASIASRNAGKLPGALGRYIDNIVKPKKDWRLILAEFVSTEITDYSFNPPDRRFSDFDFFMPDFNEEDTTVKDLIFLVDTSGSVGVKELEEFYSELVGAIGQFKNRLEGKLGFFDYECQALESFDDVESLKNIKITGGGGTSFINALQYVADNTEESDINGIVIFTDGYAPFPEESIARGVPVLWVIHGDSDVVPPWGQVISLK